MPLPGDTTPGGRGAGGRTTTDHGDEMAAIGGQLGTAHEAERQRYAQLVAY
jgi:hypothetical protein